MKKSKFLSFICLSTAVFILGCGRSEEQWRLLRPLEKKLSQLQEQVPPLLSELSRAGMEIQSVRNRNDLSPSRRVEVDSAHQQLAAAFKLLSEWKTTGQENTDGVIRTYEFNIDLLKNFISQSSSAIKKSREVAASVGSEPAQDKKKSTKGLRTNP